MQHRLSPPPIPVAVVAAATVSTAAVVAVAAAVAATVLLLLPHVGAAEFALHFVGQVFQVAVIPHAYIENQQPLERSAVPADRHFHFERHLPRFALPAAVLHVPHAFRLLVAIAAPPAAAPLFAEDVV